MTDAQYLLSALAAAGYALRTADGQLFVSPAGRLPPGWRAEVAEYRAGLVALLEAEPALRAAGSVVDIGPVARLCERPWVGGGGLAAVPPGRDECDGADDRGRRWPP